jgi:glycerophosphoryl diester phosphodiesterase
MMKLSGRNLFITLASVLTVGILAALVIVNYPPRLVVPVEPRFPLETERPNRHPFTVAHRGAALHAPENTLAALDKAITLGFDWVEIDVRYTSDNVPVLLHDNAVDRTTNGSGQVARMSYAELQKLDAGSWFAKEFAGEPVPALEDTLILMQGKICVIWDAKEKPRKVAVDLFHKYGFTGGCMAVAIPWAFPEAAEKNLQALNRFWLNPPLSVNLKEVSSLPEILRKYPGVKLLTVQINHVKPELVDAAHLAGLRLYTRTVYNQEKVRAYKRPLDAGVDGLMLEDIEKLKRYLVEGSRMPGELNPPVSTSFID